MLYQDEATPAFREFCRSYDIQIVAYQPIKRQEVLANESIKAIAEAHKVTPAQVALAWLIQKGALPIPKAIDKTHINENLGAIEIKLTDEDMTKLEEL